MQEEADIDHQNEQFDEGKANFNEKLQPWDDEDPDEFNKEKTGLIEEKSRIDTFRGMGLIDEPNRKNTPEEQAVLDEVYRNMDRASFPSSYDSRALGKS